MFVDVAHTKKVNTDPSDTITALMLTFVKLFSTARLVVKLTTSSQFVKASLHKWSSQTVDDSIKKIEEKL